MKRAVGAIALLIAASFAAPGRAEVSEVRVGIMPGLAHLAWAVIQHDGLIEKHAKQAGLGDVKTSWHRFAGGGPMNDAILSNSVDFVETGPPSLIILWDKSRGAFKGLGASSSGPMMLVTRNPAVQTIKDFTEKDRIALPSIKTSSQAIVLAMAAEAIWGVGNHAKLDGLTVGRSHPDALIALLDPRNEINSHFSLPPYLDRELATPGIRPVLDAKDVVGAPFLNGMLIASQSFRSQNPKTVASTVAALDEALELIRSDRRRAAKIYLAISKENNTEEGIAAQIGDLTYERTPRGIMKIAQFMHRIGMIKTEPSSWRDMFFEEAHGLPGS
jgi:NitT/TauT family transport system substrate-binding protein